MPSKYVPPHLRNASGASQSGVASSNSSQGQANPSTQPSRQSRGYVSSTTVRPQQTQQATQSTERPARDASSTAPVFNSQNRSQSGGYTQSRGYTANRGSYGREQPLFDKSIVWYVEEFPPKPQPVVATEAVKAEKAETESSKATYSRWDFRSAEQGKGKGGSSQTTNNGLTELGFHGSTIERQAEVDDLFGHQLLTGLNFDKYDSIPVETSGDNAPTPLAYFTDAPLPPRLLRNLALAGFTKPTPVQKYSIPIGLSDRDLMACAQTGSGKTGAFLFPIIAQLLTRGALISKGNCDRLRSESGRNRRIGGFSGSIEPNALVLAPTRELAVQIFEEAVKFTYATGIRPVVVYGGTNVREQVGSVRQGCDILVATPGRLIDFLDRGIVSLACVQFFVLDEADRCLDMGFEPSIRKIVSEADLPTSDLRRTFMFSATFPQEIQKLASDFLTDYLFLTVGRVGSAATDITQHFELCYTDDDKREKLIKTLSGLEGGLVVVFVETKRGAENLQYFLQKNRFPATSIHGDRSQQEREQALESFKTGEFPILVATDVAARGLDVANVTVVINYDLPNVIEDYVHRIGRTGRAGNNGTALSFYDPSKNNNIQSSLVELLKENKQSVPDFLSKGFSNYGNNSGGGGFNRSGFGGSNNNNKGGNSAFGNKFGGRDFRGKNGSSGNSGTRNSGGGNNNNTNSNNYNTGQQQQSSRKQDAW